MLLDSDKIKKTTFRSLVVMLFISFAYDLLWLFMSYSAYSSSESSDGGVEKAVRNFSLVISVISLLFRVSYKEYLIILIGHCYHCILERFY
jgi:hypothetical protein